MAIKVNGTTVIDDSRNLSNVGGLKTVNGTSIVGSGNISAGASTTYNAVGTYIFGYTTSKVTNNSTKSGSSIEPAGIGYQDPVSDDNQATGYGTKGSSTLSGTWRVMGRRNAGYSAGATLFVRIS